MPSVVTARNDVNSMIPLNSQVAKIKRRNYFFLIRVAGLLLITSLLIRFVRINTLLRWLYCDRRNAARNPAVAAEAARYVDAVLRRVPFLPGSKCLPRALTLYYFATRCGLPVSFHCGVKKNESHLEGHAWLALDGMPFLEVGAPDCEYAVTFSFPSEGPNAHSTNLF